jgi:hypothetical protein
MMTCGVIKSRNVTGLLVMVLAIVCLSSVLNSADGTVIVNPWDEENSFIERYGSVLLPQSLAATTPPFGLNVNYEFIQDTFYDIGGVNYLSNNQAGYKKTILLNEATGHTTYGKYKLVKENMSLPDVTMSLLKNSAVVDQTGLLASFNVDVDAEIASPTKKDQGRIITKRLLRGSVELIGLKNGQVRIKTRGIKKSSIVSISNGNQTITKGNRRTISNKDLLQIMKTGNLFTIELEGLSIPFKICTNKDFTIVTKLTSNATNIGAVSGAEVKFTPEESFLLPSLLAPPSAYSGSGVDTAEGAETILYQHVYSYSNTSAVPEPTAMALLLVGGAMYLPRYKNRFRKIPK